MTKTVIKKLLIFVAAALFGFLCLFSGGKVASAAWDSYKFTKYDVGLEVREDKTVKVYERLETVWNSYKRSLIRDVQRISATKRIVNGKRIQGKDYYAKISDISATLDGGECDWHVIGKDDDFYLDEFFSIEMKRPDGDTFTLGEPYVFELSYVYDMSDDRISAVEDFTYDILGYEMADVDHFTAKVTFEKLPESMDISTRSKDALSWTPREDRGEYVNIGGNSIEICAAQRSKGNGLTVQVLLPDGYFTGATLDFYWYYIIFAVIAALGIVAGLVLFLKFAIQKKPLVTVEFYPPEGVSIMKYSSIWHRGAKGRDAAALILKWADMDFISIMKDGKRDLILYTTGKLPGDVDPRGKKYCENDAEENFFNQLFMFGIAGGNKFSTKLFRHANSMSKQKVYEAVEKLVEKGDKPKNVKGGAEVARNVLPFVGLIPTVSVMIYQSILTQGALAAFFLVFLAAGTLTGVMFRKFPSVFLVLFPLVFYGVVYTMYTVTFTMPLYDYGCLYIIAPVWWAVNVFCLQFLIRDKRTESADRAYGKMLGFKKFLLTAELPRIQKLFDDNPEYFSDILPYCMIMGISGKVKKRFASLDFDLPSFVNEGIDEGWVYRSFSHTSVPSGFSVMGGGGSSGGGHGGGGHGGSSGGGGGGGGSRSR